MYFLKQLTRQIFMNSQVAFRIPNRQEGVHLITVTSCIFFFFLGLRKYPVVILRVIFLFFQILRHALLNWLSYTISENIVFKEFCKQHTIIKKQFF